MRLCICHRSFPPATRCKEKYWEVPAVSELVSSYQNRWKAVNSILLHEAEQNKKDRLPMDGTLHSMYLASIYWNTEKVSQEICPYTARETIAKTEHILPAIQRLKRCSEHGSAPDPRVSICRFSPNSLMSQNDPFPRVMLPNLSVPTINLHILAKCRFIFNTSAMRTVYLTAPNT